MSVIDSLGIEHIMATPGRTRVTPDVPAPVVPEKKKRGPKPGTKYRKKVTVSGLGFPPGKVDVVRESCAVPSADVVKGEDIYAKWNHMVDVLLAEYSHQQDLRDAAQAKMDYVDGLYRNMTNGEFSLHKDGMSQ